MNALTRARHIVRRYADGGSDDTDFDPIVSIGGKPAPVRPQQPPIPPLPGSPGQKALPVPEESFTDQYQREYSPVQAWRDPNISGPTNIVGSMGVDVARPIAEGPTVQNVAGAAAALPFGPMPERAGAKEVEYWSQKIAQHLMELHGSSDNAHQLISDALINMSPRADTAVLQHFPPSIINGIIDHRWNEALKAIKATPDYLQAPLAALADVFQDHPHKYGFIGVNTDANAMLLNHRYPGVKEEYDTDGMAEDLHHMTKMGYGEHANNIIKALPNNLHDDLKAATKKLKNEYSDSDIEDYYAQQHESESHQHALATGEPQANWETFKSVIRPMDWGSYSPTKDTFTKADIPNWNRAMKAGFNPNAVLWRGSRTRAGYPPEWSPPRKAKPDYEPAVFLSDQKHIAKSYADSMGESGVTKWIARGPKVGRVDWTDIVPPYDSSELEGPGASDYSSQHMDRLVRAGHEDGYDMLVIHNMLDQGSLGEPQTQYAVLNPAILRAPHAKFDPKNLRKSIPLAGVAGGGLYTYGTMRGNQE